MPAGIHLGRRLRPAAHQHAVAEEAVHHLHHVVAAKHQLVARVELAILQHAEVLGAARGQAERVLLGIVDDGQAGEAAIGLGAPVRIDASPKAAVSVNSTSGTNPGDAFWPSNGNAPAAETRPRRIRVSGVGPAELSARF